MKFINSISTSSAFIFILMNGFQIIKTMKGTDENPTEISGSPDTPEGEASFRSTSSQPVHSSEGETSFRSTSSPPVYSPEGEASFRSTSSPPVYSPEGEASFRSSSPPPVIDTVSLGSPSSFGSHSSPTASLDGGNETVLNERIHYVEVPDVNVFLSKVSCLPVLKGKSEMFRLEVEEPSPCNFCHATVIEASKAMGEPEVVEVAKKELKTQLEKNKALNVPLDNDAWLVRFLRLRLYDVAATYELIEKYYNFKAQHGEELFDKIVPKNLRYVFEKNIFVVMPNRDQAGRRILIFRAKNWKTEAVDIEDLLRVAVLLGEAASYEPSTQIMGVVFIIDMKGFTGKHAYKFGITNAKMIMDYIQFCAPFKIERFHIVNESTFATVLIKLFRRFVTDAVHGRAIFHGSSKKSLHKFVYREYLPDIFGGPLSLPKISGNEWDEILELGTQEYNAIISFGLKKQDQIPTVVGDEPTTSGSAKKLGEEPTMSASFKKKLSFGKWRSGKEKPGRG